MVRNFYDGVIRVDYFSETLISSCYYRQLSPSSTVATCGPKNINLKNYCGHKNIWTSTKYMCTYQPSIPYPCLVSLSLELGSAGVSRPVRSSIIATA